jgi:5-methylcytosine-specific restriction endonuclease McrA
VSDSPSFDLKAQVKLLADAVDRLTVGDRKRMVRKRVIDDGLATQEGVSKRVLASKRAPVLARDGGRCIVCGYGIFAALQIHHIVARADGGNNDPDNLITLCANCHLLVHHGIIHPDHLRALLASHAEAKDDYLHIERQLGYKRESACTYPLRHKKR